MRRSWLVGFVSILSLGVAVRAEEPVSFADGRLKAIVEDALWASDPTPTDMLGLTSLDGLAAGITSLEGLQYAHNLQILSLRENEIRDLTPLSGLTNLKTLNLSMNQITDLSPLSGLVNLTTLDLHDNLNLSDISPVAGLVSLQTIVLRFDSVSDVSPLAGLSHLQHADLWENLISDISPLLSLTSLKYLDLRYNPLDEEACSTYIPRIHENNPGVTVVSSECSSVPRPREISLSSTAGGSVTTPGEGQFVYPNGTVLQLKATPDPGYVFVGWSGDYSGSQNPTSLTLTEDVQTRANFASVLKELWVDDDAADDPGPRDAAISDPNENGTPEHPFDRIQKALEVAQSGASVFVRPGTYRENIDTLFKGIHLAAVNPDDPSAGPCAVIESAGIGPAVRITGYGIECSLSGFVITRGTDASAALSCSDCDLIITHCLIVGNRCSGLNGAAVYFRNSRAVLTHCTIADNYAGPGGAGLLLDNSDVTVTDSIFWGNEPSEVLERGRSDALIRYCCVRGWWPDLGNIYADPLLARRGHWADPADPNAAIAPLDPRAIWMDGDYHLKSQAGRWDPIAGSWVIDSATSPAIDAGDLASPIGDEPWPNGEIVNMGAYGGTSEASKSPRGADL